MDAGVGCSNSVAAAAHWEHRRTFTCIAQRARNR
jgi:hypothetical protein